MKVVLISLEAWDDVWRRNQHLSMELIRQGFVTSLWFVEPPSRELNSTRLRAVAPGIVAVTPPERLPKTLGGLALTGQRLRRSLVENADLLWVNDSTIGVHCLTPRTPAIYDVTDDWRTAGFPPRIVRRIVAAENRLARNATTIVCSDVLRARWKARYGVDAAVVRNGIDTQAWTAAQPIALTGQGPHVGYIGTLHEQRLDVDLVIDLTRRPEIGTLHLVGPNCLATPLSRRLEQVPGLRLHGAVPAGEVPAWMKAMDVLISPHLVNDFTLSLDAIKAHEYAFSGRPVVATPTSGFTTAGHTSVVPTALFADAVVRATQLPFDYASATDDPPDASWAQRARDFWSATVASPTMGISQKETVRA